MKAVMIRKYGGPEVLELAEVPAPKAKDNEVVVQVAATSVNPVDWLVRDGGAKSYVRVTFPVILGCELAGVVAEVGSQVKHLAVGDEVFAMMPQDWGAHAERVALEGSLVVKKPTSLSMVEAASVGVAALTALNGIRKVGAITPGMRLLINGASSAVGMAAIQIAKAEWAHVTGVCSAASFELAKSLGADEVIDYKTSDFTTRPEKYDLVFDCVGTKPYGACQQVLQGRKVHVTVQPGVGTFIRQGLNPFFGVKVFWLVTKGNGEQLSYIKSLIESGKFKTVIDRVFPIADVAKAQEYSKAGRAKGKIVLTFS